MSNAHQKVRIGINPLTWSNDDLPTLGGETTLETSLREGREVGYEGFELGNKFPRDPEVLGPILAMHGLCLASGWFSGGLMAHGVDAEIEAIKPHVHLLKSLGCSALIYCDITGTVQGERWTPLSRRPRLRDDQWKEFCSGLTQVADFVADQGLQLAYHHHMGTMIEKRVEVDRMLEGSGDNVGLLIDTGHMFFSGGDPVDLARTYAARTRHVHCKDMRHDITRDAVNRDTSFIDALLAGAFAVPGDGCIDYPAVLKALADADYEGWLIVEAEQDPTVAPSYANAKRGYDHLNRLAAEAGLL